MTQQPAIRQDDAQVIPLRISLEQRRMERYTQDLYDAIERRRAENGGRIPWKESKQGRYLDVHAPPRGHETLRSLACGCTQMFGLYGLNSCPSWDPVEMWPMRVWQESGRVDHPRTDPRWQDPPCGREGVIWLDPAELRD